MTQAQAYNKNEVVKSEAQVPQTQAAYDPSNQEILNSDIIIPRLLLMQGLSDAVANRKAQMGDMIRSTTLEKLGDPEVPVDFIPLKMSADWIESEQVGGKFEFRTTVPRNAANDDLPWEFDKNGVKWKRTKCLNVYALLTADVQAFLAEMAGLGSGEMPDLSKSLLPILLSFRSTSFSAGRAVATYFAQVRDMLKYNPNVRPYGYSLTLACQPEKNDKGNYFVFKVEGKPKKIDDKFFPEVTRWYTTLNTLKTIKVDQGDDETDAAPVGTASKF